VQAQLNALKNVKGFFSFKKGLKYKEKEYDKYSHKGYLNKDDQAEGVGIRIFKSGEKQIGEFLNNQLHRWGKVHLPNGESYWGNSRIARKKDMGHLSMLVETNTSGNGCRISNTAMEYSDGQMEEYTMDK
jgi:hypothetical protein